MNGPSIGDGSSSTLKHNNNNDDDNNNKDAATNTDARRGSLVDDESASDRALSAFEVNVVGAELLLARCWSVLFHSKTLFACFCISQTIVIFRATGRADEYTGVGARFREALRRLPSAGSVVWRRRRSPIAAYDKKKKLSVFVGRNHYSHK
jgi:hypothetical protein